MRNFIELVDLKLCHRVVHEKNNIYLSLSTFPPIPVSRSLIYQIGREINVFLSQLPTHKLVETKTKSPVLLLIFEKDLQNCGENISLATHSNKFGDKLVQRKQQTARQITFTSNKFPI